MVVDWVQIVAKKEDIYRIASNDYERFVNALVIGERRSLNIGTPGLCIQRHLSFFLPLSITNSFKEVGGVQVEYEGSFVCADIVLISNV